MSTALGDELGRGVSSRVYAWGDGRVVKVFEPEFASLAPTEAERAAAVHRAGVPSPAVHGSVDVDGRVGIVFDRLDGPSAMREPGAGELVARLHVAVHDVDVGAADGLPQLADTLSGMGAPGLRAGHAVFHGDFHPGNVMRHRGTWTVIDWSNAHLAPPAADVACSVLAIGFRGLRDDHPDAARHHRRRLRVADEYLATYRALRPSAVEDLLVWTTVIGRLLLEREPAIAYADELRARWIAD